MHIKTTASVQRWQKLWHMLYKKCHNDIIIQTLLSGLWRGVITPPFLHLPIDISVKISIIILSVTFVTDRKGGDGIHEI